MPSNPFLDPEFLVRWSQAKPELVEPAVDAAIAESEAALQRIEGASGELTFEDTFLALDEATDGLNRAWNRISHLQLVEDSPALREAYNKALPKVSAFTARIPLRPALWEKLRAFGESAESKKLAPARARFVSETMAEFREAGAGLPPEKRARLEAIDIELGGLTQKYSENTLDATNAWQLVVEDEGRLRGLPEHAKAGAKAAAQAKGIGSPEKPAWRFTLHMPSYEPFLTHVDDDALREEMWTALSLVGSVAPHDNAPLIKTILALRAEKADLLGKKHFADLITGRRMTKSGKRALEFVDDVRKRFSAAFARDCSELEESKAAETGSPVARLSPWELLYRAERLRKARYAFDGEELRPYFPMDRVMSGLFELTGRIFGIRVVGRPPGEVETWNPEVRFYDVFDRSGRHAGSFYTDWHPRDSKRGGAWMSAMTMGALRADGTREPHLGTINGNLTPPGTGRPALLSHREVETIFHEFGHLLHQLLSEVELKAFGGTSVAWDFVELPSQIMENWCWERESLDLFARHFETGATVPEALFRKMNAARNFRSAAMTMRHMAIAKIDLIMHMEPKEFAGDVDIEAVVQARVADCVIPTVPPAPSVVRRIGHLFDNPVGYAAGFYSYKWAEVLDADAFTRFKKEGVFSSKVGREFVDKILSRGNSEDPAVLFRDFMGRDPDLSALLTRSGLAA